MALHGDGFISPALDLRQALAPGAEGDAQRAALQVQVRALLEPGLDRTEGQAAAVHLHVFSHLPANDLLALHDAVRSVLAQRAAAGRSARQIVLAATLRRNYHHWKAGNELFELIHREPNQTALPVAQSRAELDALKQQRSRERDTLPAHPVIDLAPSPEKAPAPQRATAVVTAPDGSETGAEMKVRPSPDGKAAGDRPRTPVGQPPIVVTPINAPSDMDSSKPFVSDCALSSWLARSGGARRRAVGRHGGSRASESAVESSLKWLAIHQSADGSWDVDAFQVNCREGDPLCEPGTVDTGPAGDVRAIACALLAFLGAGYDHKFMSKWRNVVKNGLTALQARHDATSGLIGGRVSSHAWATLALVEAYALTSHPEAKVPADRALATLLARQDATTGLWSDGTVADARPEMETTAIAALAIQVAWKSGLDVPARQVLDRLRSGGPATLTPAFATTPGAAALVAVLVGAAETERRQALTRLATDASADLLQVALASTAAFQEGGETWTTWNAAVRDRLVTVQRRDPACFAGSFDTVAARPADHRIITTVAGCLTLETYYRYPPGLTTAPAAAPAP